MSKRSLANSKSAISNYAKSSAAEITLPKVALRKVVLRKVACPKVTSQKVICPIVIRRKLTLADTRLLAKDDGEKSEPFITTKRFREGEREYIM